MALNTIQSLKNILKISSLCSRPTEIRINPGVIATAFLSSSVSFACVVLAG
jgi:hypothetical protein